MTNIRPGFQGGRNIAMKIPPYQYKPARDFYESVLGLPLLEEHESGCSFEFGPLHLHLDILPAIGQPELWLEVITDDTALAADYLADEGVVRRDEAEQLPEGFDGFWISNPAGIIHLVAGFGDA
jgi:catechol 2,3-dioxygenase-like lactoylglutathione lyase family enzyme